MISNHLAVTPSIDLSPQHCRADLQRLQELRLRVSVLSKGAYNDVSLDDLHEYYNCLLECETQGILGGDDDSRMKFQWESALTDELQCRGSLVWERANVIWNIATLEAFGASHQTLDSKLGWSQAAQQFQNAASWLQHLPPTVGDVLDFSDTFLEYWQAFLMAQSQRCVYESLACAPRPKHLLLAKLAAAAVPLYGELESMIRQDEESHGLLGQISSITNHWADYSRAWGMYMSSKAEYHQAVVGREKKQWGQELARLDLAHRFATLCCQYCERAPLTSLQELHEAVQDSLSSIDARIHQARYDNETTHKQPIPPHQDLPEIRGEKLVNIDQPLTKLLKPMQGEPMFQGGFSEAPNIDLYVEQFHSEMDQLVHELSRIAEQQSESARTALATANLPHSLTIYKQERQGNGFPTPLWDRVTRIQRERRITCLKQDLWELRDAAEAARTTYQKIKSQLDVDVDSDKYFRKENPRFQGRNSEEVQLPFRRSLANHDQVLRAAQAGDAIILKQTELLDTHPKYKLLQCQKSQLDRLISGSGSCGRMIDTSKLDRLVVEMSSLIKNRETLLHTLQREIQHYDIQGALEAHKGGVQTYEDVVNYAKSSFDGIVLELRANFDKQIDLLHTIMAENDYFLKARDQKSISAANSCVAMIEEAIDEIEELSGYMEEGKSFYNLIIPKLEKLKHEVGDNSARLTIERLEYVDQIYRNRQEADDAEMAKRMSGDGTNRGAIPAAKPPFRGAMHVAGHPTPHPMAPPTFRVDDEKVAALVAMDFDASRVVAALTKHKNDVEQALNELLF